MKEKIINLLKAEVNYFKTLEAELGTSNQYTVKAFDRMMTFKEFASKLLNEEISIRKDGSIHIGWEE